MSDKPCVCLDTLGGDFGPSVVLEGAVKALEADPKLRLLLTGPEEVITPFAQAHPGRVECQATTEEIAMDEHPAQAVRSKKDSSIVVGCKMVKEGRADAFFSAGSTGACMTAATLHIGRIKGVERPLLVTVVPAPARHVVLGDVGANADCKPSYLVQFALMATAYATAVLGMEDVQVGLLNIGSEDSKGSQAAQETHALMREQVPNFYGNVEGGDIMKGTCQVVITDGFTGNVVLKTMEGSLKTILKEIKGVFYGSGKGKMAGLLVKGDMSALKERFNADAYGGAPLLGLKAPAIIGHGSSSPEAIASGIAMAARAANADLCGRIAAALEAQQGL